MTADFPCFYLPFRRERGRTVPPPLVSVVASLAAIGVVTWSVEVFVEHVADAAVNLGVPSFLLTVALTGIDLENAVPGIVAAAGDLPDMALGMANYAI